MTVATLHRYTKTWGQSWSILVKEKANAYWSEAAMRLNVILSVIALGSMLIGYTFKQESRLARIEFTNEIQSTKETELTTQMLEYKGQIQAITVAFQADQINKAEIKTMLNVIIQRLDRIEQRGK